jgi:CheY-like chemotaxis protein
MSTPEPGVGKHYSVFVVDDDPVMLTLIVQRLTAGGFAVVSAKSAEEALDRIVHERPDCVVLDIMMPGMDGLELCRQLRAAPQLSATKIVIMSGKTYDSDRRRALALGADAFITKPVQPETFAEQVRRIVEDRIHLVFWGVHGTLPVPGRQTVRYGGNTPCVSMELARGPLLVLDAGTGIKALSDHLLARKATRLDVKVFISHPHWDHINALPFFAPLYRRGNSVEVLGPCQGDKCVEDYIKEQMDGVYFPITAQEFGARVIYTNLREEVLAIDRVRVRTMLLNHPGHCLGYRVEYRERAVCYITDNEIYPEDTGLRDPGYISKLEAFVRGADALIADTTYMDKEYWSHINWGHSPLGEVVDLAHRAGVQTLYLFHHDPDQDDEAIDRKLEAARTHLMRLDSATKCVAPEEGQLLII